MYIYIYQCWFPTKASCTKSCVFPAKAQYAEISKQNVAIAAASIPRTVPWKKCLGQVFLQETLMVGD